MKLKILILSLYTLCASVLYAQDTQNSQSKVRFTIDKTFYQVLSLHQKGMIEEKIQELNTFINNKIITSLPKRIYDKISDLRIKIQLTNQPGRDGLFTPDEKSNEHTISLQLMQLSSNGINSLLAHEIYHAIHFHINPDEYPWVREGLAQVFESFITGNFNGSNISAAVKNPMTPLLGNYDVDETDRAQYGHNLLYFSYLINRCGGEKIFWKMTEGNSTGDKGSYLIDSVLREMDSTNEECLDFPSSAINFEVAKMHNRLQYKSPKEINKYYVSATDIVPRFPSVNSEKELEHLIKKMPSLSSYKIPMNTFIKLKGKCSNCEIFYAGNTFPYMVTQKAPEDAKDISVILVKTSQK